MMSEQAKAARRAYRAEWARKNRDKVKRQQERYWEKRAQREAALDNMPRPAEAQQKQAE